MLRILILLALALCVFLLGFHMGMSACMRYCVMFDGEQKELIDNQPKATGL